MFDQIDEKTLREILRVMHGVPASAHETVKRRPIRLAKLREGGLRNLRFGLTFPRRDNHAPVGRRKQIALAMPVPCQGFHVIGVSESREKNKPREKSRFRAAPLPESLCKGKAIINNSQHI